MEEYGEGQRTDLPDEEGEGVDGGKNTWLTDPVNELGDHDWQVWLTDWQTDWLTEWMKEWLVDWLIEDCLPTGWLMVNWLTDWLIDWLTD